MDEAELGVIARAYQNAQEKLAEERDELTSAVREAYAGGMRKADILRAIDHVWSREWLDRTLDGVDRTSGA